MKYWCIRLSASFFVIGAFAVSTLAGVQFGLLVGVALFLLLAAFGIYLHKIAERMKQGSEESK
jgi:hypothetical protein